MSGVCNKRRAIDGEVAVHCVLLPQPIKQRQLIAREIMFMAAFVCQQQTLMINDVISVSCKFDMCLPCHIRIYQPAAVKCRRHRFITFVYIGLNSDVWFLVH